MSVLPRECHLQCQRLNLCTTICLNTSECCVCTYLYYVLLDQSRRVACWRFDQDIATWWPGKKGTGKITSLIKKNVCVHCITLYHNTGVTGRMMFALMHWLFLGLECTIMRRQIWYNVIQSTYNIYWFFKSYFSMIFHRDVLDSGNYSWAQFYTCSSTQLISVSNSFYFMWHFC